MKRFGAETYREMPWTNGRGLTREIAREEREGRLLWRLSLADITEDGPFSLLPELSRWLVCVGGRGLRLVGPGLELEAPPWQPVAFPGHVPVETVLSAGPVHALNLMFDEDAMQASAASVAGPGAVEGASGGTLLFVAPDGAAVEPLDCGDTGLLDPGERMELPAGAHVLVMDLAPGGG